MGNNERNKMIIGMVNDLLEKGEEEYQKCKLILFSQRASKSLKVRLSRLSGIISSSQKKRLL